MNEAFALEVKRRDFLYVATAAAAGVGGLFALWPFKADALIAKLRDPQSQEHQQPQYAANWCRALDPDYLVVVGTCTHLGCIPTFMPKPGSVDANWPGGYLCHCHGSRYDLAGRVFQNVPAPYNLPVPPYSFPRPHTLNIGENPPGAMFDLSSIVQI